MTNKTCLLIITLLVIVFSSLLALIVVEFNSSNKTPTTVTQSRSIPSFAKEKEIEKLTLFEQKSEPTKDPTSTQPAVQEKPKTEVTKEEAINIALQQIPDGTVSDVEYETKFGKASIVVEVQSQSRGEIDVIIDIQTGEVLGIED